MTFKIGFLFFCLLAPTVVFAEWQASWATVDGVGLYIFDKDPSTRKISVNIKWITAPTKEYSDGEVVETAVLESDVGPENLNKLYTLLLTAKATQNRCYIWVEPQVFIKGNRIKLGDVFCLSER